MLLRGSATEQSLWIERAVQSATPRYPYFLPDRYSIPRLRQLSLQKSDGNTKVSAGDQPTTASLAGTTPDETRLKGWLMLQELDQNLKVDRRVGLNRRLRNDRRNGTGLPPQGEERRLTTPRRKVERRRQIDPTTCERDYSGDEVEFMRAMDEYKRRSGRPFPTWSEVLEVIRGLGYAKPVAASPETALLPAR